MSGARASLFDARFLDALYAKLVAEVERQDDVHPAGYPATRDGVRFGIATAQDELDEALEAWREAKRLPLTQHQWQAVKDELVQVAAVVIRTLRQMPETGDHV